ncbi:hypothetical protein H920_19206 [Fukomys damarensis]|uniref:Uncharacterized protein n=1 Tax=Fukomys damarensis TaxID=885580 RepID=A0A091CQ54_FUKDA|nr:hypothetical protein H920_19206 [Fukomys damarensis]
MSFAEHTGGGGQPLCKRSGIQARRRLGSSGQGYAQQGAYSQQSEKQQHQRKQHSPAALASLAGLRALWSRKPGSDLPQERVEQEHPPFLLRRPAALRPSCSQGPRSGLRPLRHSVLPTLKAAQKSCQVKAEPELSQEAQTAPCFSQDRVRARPLRHPCPLLLGFCGSDGCWDGGRTLGGWDKGEKLREGSRKEPQ